MGVFFKGCADPSRRLLNRYMDSLQIKNKQLQIQGTRIIYDLCGGTGSWSKPYKDNGYTVRLIDIKDGNDIRWLRKPKEIVHGVLAAPPCTHFAHCGATWWEEKDRDGRTLNDIAIMDACIRFIFAVNPVWWVLENPWGRMVDFLGSPIMKFHPYEYGDPYQKLTYLWGKFNCPKKKIVKVPLKDSKEHGVDVYLGITHMAYGKRSALRSVTPPGFAAAFFEANR